MINLLTGIESTASALDAERVRMDVIAGNIANANVTKDVDGKEVVYCCRGSDSEKGVEVVNRSSYQRGWNV